MGRVTDLVSGATFDKLPSIFKRTVNMRRDEIIGKIEHNNNKRRNIDCNTVNGIYISNKMKIFRLYLENAFSFLEQV